MDEDHNPSTRSVDVPAADAPPLAADGGIEWSHELVDQLDWHWTTKLWPRWEGLSDEEYLWAPAARNLWTVHRVGEGRQDHGTGDFRVDFDFPAPDPAPVTTIAWRISHLVVGVFGMRAAAHFGGPPIDYDSYAYPGTAAHALADLDAAYRRWIDGVRGLGEAGLRRRCGPAEGPHAAAPMATLVLHINREAIHHGAEISLLRDLYAARALD